MKKVLLICEDKINNRLAGPAQRYLELCQTLNAKYDTTLLADFAPEFIPPVGVKILREPIFKRYNLGFKVSLPNTKIYKELKNYDVVIAQGGELHASGLLNKIHQPLVIDLYCPWFFEDMQTVHNKKKKTFNNNVLEPILTMLKYGDFFICANEKQRDFYLALLLHSRRITPTIYSQDPTLRNLIDIVPSGLPANPAQHSKNVLKGVLPGIKQSDKIVLWFGGLWDWLSPESVVTAM
ncbi:MAG: hypothetical protein ABIH69_08000, partial [bacterium]